MKFGSFELHTVTDGPMWLDGGAMFGIVPRPLWSKKKQPDDRNRIPMGLNCLLIIAPDGRKLLIDTGTGTKLSPKEHEIYGIRPRLHQSLAEKGVTPEDIDFVILTHMHFDHAGGCTIRDEDGTLKPTFPNARYLVQRKEWQEVRSPSGDRTRGVYFRQDWEPLADGDRVDLLDGSNEIIPGIRGIRTGGHTIGHQMIEIDGGAGKAYYVADLIPTDGHFHHLWVMGYDNFPIESVEQKKAFLTKASQERHLIILEHDHRSTMGYFDLEKGFDRVQEIDLS